MKKILVPTDLSDLSGYALTLAQKFANNSGAEIYALMVFPTPAEVLFDREGEQVDPGDYDLERIKIEQQKSISSLSEWLEKYKIPAIPVFKTGNLTDQILNCIKKENIDMVVMGTHGLHGLRELIANSVTEQVVRQSSVPVLSLKCDRSDLEIKNIVWASSFRKGTIKKNAFIKELQEAFGAKIHLLRVNTVNDLVSTRNLQKSMKAFAALNGLTHVAYHIYSDKDIESGILHFTEDEGMDLISIAVEPDSLSRLFHKSVSSALVNHVYHPVLTIKN